MSSRIRRIIEDEMTHKFSSVMHVTDSAIVRAQIQKHSYGFGTFVATQVAEIQAKSDPSEWWWISSELNSADLLTRPHDPSKAITSSLWKYGPEFMALPLEMWSVSQSTDCELPERINVNLPQCLNSEKDTIIDVSKVQELQYVNRSHC